MKEREHTTAGSSVLKPEDDAPDLASLDLSEGWFEEAGERIGDAEGRAAFRRALSEHVTVSLDSDVAAYFHSKAGRDGVEKAVNRFLRKHLRLEAKKAS